MGFSATVRDIKNVLYNYVENNNFTLCIFRLILPECITSIHALWVTDLLEGATGQHAATVVALVRHTMGCCIYYKRTSVTTYLFTLIS